jgi:hypothetical protein
VQEDSRDPRNEELRVRRSLPSEYKSGGGWLTKFFSSFGFVNGALIGGLFSGLTLQVFESRQQEARVEMLEAEVVELKSRAKELSRIVGFSEVVASRCGDILSKENENFTRYVFCRDLAESFPEVVGLRE